MRSVTSDAWVKGCRMERGSSQAQARLSSKPTNEPAASSVMPWLSLRAAAARASATRWRWYSASLFTDAA